METIKFTQLVFIQNLMEECKLHDGPVTKTSVVSGQVLIKGDGFEW